MSDEERAIICAALAFAAADRRDDAATEAADSAAISAADHVRGDAAHEAAARAAWEERCNRLDALLAAVQRYEEARRG
jgi:hypothetical protein